MVIRAPQAQELHKISQRKQATILIHWQEKSFS